MARRLLTREQALKWNPDWSATDREVIEQNLNRLNAETYYVPPSGGYVGCIDVEGRIVMTLHPGYVEFKPQFAPDDLPETEYPSLAFSTFHPRASPTAAPREPTDDVCPIHHVTLPLTGICDECR